MTLQCHCGVTVEICDVTGSASAQSRSFLVKMMGKPAKLLTMIRLGSQIRLTRREVERFVKITDIEPVGIRTIDEFEDYIARCKAHYWGVSSETRFLHWLIDRECTRCRRAA